MAKMDFTYEYNTPLSPEDEAEYLKWHSSNRLDKNGKEIEDDYDYDMRGAWKAGYGADDNGHFPDTYKKPNHPTFSGQSQYYAANTMHEGINPTYLGGYWMSGIGDRDIFFPSDYNMYMYDNMGFKPDYDHPFLERFGEKIYNPDYWDTRPKMKNINPFEAMPNAGPLSSLNSVMRRQGGHQEGLGIGFDKWSLYHRLNRRPYQSKGNSEAVLQYGTPKQSARLSYGKDAKGHTRAFLDYERTF